jgi:cytochrome bd ubiquinol oxidase subunit II
VSLAEAPIVLVLAGLAAYMVLAGADFGAGFWQLPGSSGGTAKAIREHAHHAMGPVWEANHVWLIFVLVVAWTAYPRAFGSIASTLAVPLFIAGLGIVARGTAYALRSGTETPREERVVEVGMAVASIITPFALGAAIGGVASERVPVGNARGDLVTSWLNPTSVAIGAIAVAAAAYLAAVYLAADAARLGRADLERAFRTRALVMAAVAGAAALAGLLVVRGDAHRVWHGLGHGGGLAAVVVSALAGLATVGLVAARRYGWARISAALAVTAIVAGWGLAQRPQLLPGLTIDQAAAGHSTLVALLVALALGALLLAPSLGFLFALVLGGHFDTTAAPTPPAEATSATTAGMRPLAVAAGGFVVAAGLMVFIDATWALIVGVSGLLGSVALGFVALANLAVAAEAGSERR